MHIHIHFHYVQITYIYWLYLSSIHIKDLNLTDLWLIRLKCDLLDLFSIDEVNFNIKSILISNL